MPKAEALREAKTWLREPSPVGGFGPDGQAIRWHRRGKGTKAREQGERDAAIPAGGDDDRPYEPPHFWAAFVLAGDPD